MLVLGVLAVGTVGFWLVWRGQHASWLDAFYMTAITITTIGYEEVYNLEGFGRIWAVLVAFLDVGSLFYSFGVVMEYVVTTRLMDPRGRRKMQNRIAGLKGHVVVAGLGRVGRQAASSCKRPGFPSWWWTLAKPPTNTPRSTAFSSC
jgi:voltage-gated potassium channel